MEGYHLNFSASIMKVNIRNPSHIPTTPVKGEEQGRFNSWVLVSKKSRRKTTQNTKLHVYVGLVTPLFKNVTETRFFFYPLQGKQSAYSKSCRQVTRRLVQNPYFSDE